MREYDIHIVGTFPDMSEADILDAIDAALCKEKRGEGECGCAFVASIKEVPDEDGT